MKKMSKKQVILFLIAVMMTNIALMEDLVLSPVFQKIFEIFAAHNFLANFIVSGPQLFVVIASFLSGFIINKTGKKNLLVIGTVLFSIGSILGAFFVNPYYMAVMRVLVGIGTGFINVCAVALLTEVITDEELRAKYMGYYNASMSLFGIIFSYTAGVLAVSKWTNVFKLNWTSVLMVLLVILFIPNIRNNEVSSSSEADSVQTGYGSDFWFQCISFVFYCICFSIIGIYFTSTYVLENNLGNEMTVGTINLIMQAVTIIGGILFGILYKRFKDMLPLLLYAASFVSVAILFLYPAKMTAMIFIPTIGLAYGMMFSFAYISAPAKVPSKKIDSAISVLTAAYALAQFASTYIAAGLMQLLKTSRITDIYIILAGILVILFGALLLKKKITFS